MRIQATWVPLIVLLLASTATAQPPRQAPEWKISAWLNDDPGSLADNRGRVILIDFFQLWCPGCNRFSVPLFREWEERYADREDVLVISIHSVFEGHDHQSPARLREYVEIQGIGHPVGIDAYDTPGAETPVSMRRFRTRGTPHVVIVGKQGMIRFSHFGSFDPRPVEQLIDRLLDE